MKFTDGIKPRERNILESHFRVWGYVLKHCDTVYVSETAESYSYDDIAAWRRVGFPGPNPKDKLVCTHTAEEWAFLWHIRDLFMIVANDPDSELTVKYYV